MADYFYALLRIVSLGKIMILFPYFFLNPEMSCSLPYSLWPVLDIFIQKVLECKYQLQMNLIDLLDIERPQKDIKRPKKATKVVKAKSKARGTMVSLFCNFFTFLGSLGPNRMENMFTLNSKTKKAARRPLDSRT